MTEHERIKLDRIFRGCLDGQELANNWFEQYRYIQEIAQEIYGKPREIIFEIDDQNQ